MMQCGLFVTARSYRANVTRGIFTHFIREEDAGMTSGRLDDELRRMSAIAGQIEPHCLMLFNESFAGTNECEGSEIGWRRTRREPDEPAGRPSRADLNAGPGEGRLVAWKRRRGSP